jgi:multiple sugar transport system ATP-binding protein
VEKDGVFFLTSEHETINLNSVRCAQNLPNFKGKKAVFGIRPEDVFVHEGEHKEGESFGASVLIAERTGAEVYLHLSAHGQELNARVGTNTDVKFGDKIKIKFDIKKAHLFDKESGKAI